MKVRIDALDQLFSKFIRLRDKYCQRCGGFHSLQCSHFHGRAKKSVRYDEDNACALCFGCHLYFGAHPLEHVEFFKARLGERAFDLLTLRANMPGKPDRDLITLYLKDQLAKLTEHP